ncbi:MAG TPA: amidohydrolase family protein, partial [Dehalococcoidia bacterium]|nr:amidohydrolase family protein [Dehalococcoidia bacterium]
MADLFLRNCRVYGRAGADAILIRGGRIASLGQEPDLEREAYSWRAEDIDLRGRPVLPGFIDAHIHLLAYAARLRSVDCSSATSIAAIQARVRERAARLPPGTWVRAAGYDERALREGRHPTRRELDQAAPGHPVRLDHRSGHATV